MSYNQNIFDGKNFISFVHKHIRKVKVLYIISDDERTMAHQQ